MENELAVQPTPTPPISVRQLPVIEEHLQAMKEAVLRRAEELDALVCTEDTVKAVKAARAEFRKEFAELEAAKSAVLEQVLAPVEQFKAVYRDCISGPYSAADARAKAKIDGIEAEIKQRCEDELRAYFEELRAFNRLDWLEYERLGIKVDMASAKQKTPKKLRERIAETVAGICRDARAIDNMADRDEIMVEYKRCLSLAEATETVRRRHEQIEAARMAKEANAEIEKREEEAVKRVEAVAPPEPVLTVAFRATAPKSKLIALREYMKQEGIKYE